LLIATLSAATWWASAPTLPPDWPGRYRCLALDLVRSAVPLSSQGVTFVDGVVTGFEDLGRLPDDPSFQGR